MSEQGRVKTLRNSTSKFKRRFQGVRQPVHTICMRNSQPVAIYNLKQNHQINFEESFYDAHNSKQFTRKTECSPFGRTGFSRAALESRGIPQLQRKELVRDQRPVLDGADTQQRNYSCVTEQSIAELKWRPAESYNIQKREQTFLKGLGKNVLFYCCKCYQYVFEIEKERHFPECKDSFSFKNIEREKMIGVCWQRLQRLVQLARYTSTKVREIQDLWHQVDKGIFWRMLIINYSQDSKFFTLEQIEIAFVFTYEQLLKGRMPPKQRSIFQCF